MKTKHVTWQQVAALFVSLILLLIPASGCDDTNPAGAGGEKPAGTIVSTSGCKAFAFSTADGTGGPDQECVAYLYDRASELKLTHINAAFNCCPGDITADIDIAHHLITITEHEELQACRCNCLFDVEYTIDNLPPGEYSIHVIGPYQEEGDDPLEFTVNLSLEPEGLFCVDRHHYPWFENVPPGEPKGTFIDMEGCKEFPGGTAARASADIADCIEYDYSTEQVLLLWHRNAGFNCCPITGIEIEIADNVITIHESDVGLCDCFCLYDVACQVVNLPPGEYTISVVEPLVQKGDAKLEFTVDLTSTPAGNYCVERTSYPWQ